MNTTAKVTLSAGIDSNYGLPGRYEYVIMRETSPDSDDWEILSRGTGFRSKYAAKKAGLTAFDKLAL